MKRRTFLNLSSLASLPFLTGIAPYSNSFYAENGKTKLPMNMVLDGYFFNPKEYTEMLLQIESSSGINGDFYGEGGVVNELEEEFKISTGKENAIYLPTGTMANELALRLHCGNKTNIIVHSDSHVFMDESKSAERIHQKKLVGISNNKPSFSANDLIMSMDMVGAISMENPVRRHSGSIVPLSDLKSVSEFAKKHQIKTHLDGARIHLASAYSGLTVKDYASLFDSVYISLYKYLGASGGAILVGKNDFIEQIKDYLHPLGGKVFRSWTNAAMALHFLKGLESRLLMMAEQSKEILNELNQLNELSVRTIEKGTNVAYLSSESINLESFADEMNESHEIWINYPDSGEIEIHFNESISQLGSSKFMECVKDSILKSK